jgi:hypothetical protein
VSQNDDHMQVLLDALPEALEAVGIYLDVEIRDGSLILSGEVDSVEMRDAALDLAAPIVSSAGVRIEDAIEVLDIEFEERPDEDWNKIPDVDAGMISDVGTTYSELAAEEGANRPANWR